MPDKSTATVRVAKSGPHGLPLAEVTVAGELPATQLGSLLQKVVTNEKVYQLAGLKFCGGCKSGLDINILGGDIREVIEMHV